MVRETPNLNAREFRYHLSRANYQREWGKGYRRPGFGTRVLAFFLRFVPKIGPFKALDFKIPTQQTEDLYIASVSHTLDDYKHLLAEARTREDLHLPNIDFDTGRITRAGEYSCLIRPTRACWTNWPSTTSIRFRRNCGITSWPFTAIRTPRSRPNEVPVAWQKAQEELLRLRAIAPSEAPAAQVSQSSKF